MMAGTLTTASLPLSPAVKQTFHTKAVSAGLTLEGYLRHLALKDAANGTQDSPPPKNPLGLEQWEGIVPGTFSREKIYEDVV